MKGKDKTTTERREAGRQKKRKSTHRHGKQNTKRETDMNKER